MPNDIMRREAERLRKLADTCEQEADYSTTRKLLKLVIEIDEGDIGLPHSTMAADLFNLGATCIKLNYLQEGKRYLRSALELRLSFLDSTDPLVLDTANLLLSIDDTVSDQSASQSVPIVHEVIQNRNYGTVDRS